MKTNDIDSLIEQLADDLRPARQLMPPTRLVGIVALIAAVPATAFLLAMGLRADLMTGQIDPLSAIAIGVLAVVAASSIWAALSMRQPAVGRAHGGWRGAVGVALVIPAAAFFFLIRDPHVTWAASAAHAGVSCVATGAAFGIALAAGLTVLVRSGAPSSAPRTAWAIGIGAGAGATLVASLHCPINSIAHIGLWHGMAVLVVAAAARIFVAPLLRW